MKKYLFYVVVLFFSKTLFAQKNEVFFNISQSGGFSQNLQTSILKQDYKNFGVGYNYIHKNKIYYGIGFGFNYIKSNTASNYISDSIESKTKSYSNYNQKNIDFHIGKINNWRNLLFHSQTSFNFGVSNKFYNGNDNYLKNGSNISWKETIYTNPNFYSFQAYFLQSIYYKVFSKLYVGLEVKPAITYTYSKGKSSVEQIDYINDINKITENDFKFNHLAFDVYPFIFGLRYQF